MMFYLFILESIGTSELLMIGLIALIIFGPRKLPQMMRTIGKTMAEFRRTTDDFKSTWQKEVDFEDNEFQTFESSDLLSGNQSKTGNSIGRTSGLEINKIAAPEIREVSSDNFSANISTKEESIVEEAKTETSSADKRKWL
ncbi:MAG TPA: Sec-independent protein translocase protein TatB [Pyrinomonadaceae bacterium]|nr:Sec-independent protein translocase protein TatB [Pyrinomonadaceae bacterium]